MKHTKKTTERGGTVVVGVDAKAQLDQSRGIASGWYQTADILRLITDLAAADAAVAELQSKLEILNVALAATVSVDAD